jgi:DNA-binding transcriptional LysR family regulator
MQWTDRIGRRVKMRDLHVLLAVANSGSISRAAERLAISHPVVSRTISDLEHALGVRLFDRSSQGVEPTMYGRAFLDCGVAVFDDLRRGVQQIEFLSDPTAGEVRIGGAEQVMAGFIPAIIDRVARRCSRMVFHTVQGDGHSLRAALREREVDLIVSRGGLQSSAEEDLVSEALFDEELYVVVGLRNQWVRHRKINLSELLDEPWILPPPDTVVWQLISAGFHSGGLPMPKSSVVSNSVPLRNLLLATGRYISILPRSMLHFGAEQLRVKILPVKLPGISQAVEIITLKNRMLSPTANLFIKCAREVAKSVASEPQARKSRQKNSLRANVDAQSIVAAARKFGSDRT